MEPSGQGIGPWGLLEDPTPGSAGAMDPSRLRQWTSMSASNSHPLAFSSSAKWAYNSQEFARLNPPTPLPACPKSGSTLVLYPVEVEMKQSLARPGCSLQTPVSLRALPLVSPVRTPAALSWKPGIRHRCYHHRALAAGWPVYIHLRE